MSPLHDAIAATGVRENEDFWLRVDFPTYARRLTAAGLVQYIPSSGRGQGEKYKKRASGRQGGGRIGPDWSGQVGFVCHDELLLFLPASNERADDM